jgi:hypothetical protein
MANFITSALFVVFLSALVWWGRRHEPHWVARDGTRFMTRARVLDARGGRPGRWAPVRGGIGRDSVVLQPGFTGARAVAGTYVPVARVTGGHATHAVYSLRADSPDGDKLVALRVPAHSPLVARLDAMIPH